MPRFKLTIEYDGTGLAGWQRQNDRLSVQEILEQAIYDFAQERVRTIASGRTDAGVHARGQVVHFDLEKDRTPYQVMHGVNCHLMKREHPVMALDAEIAPDDFHARFSAKRRSYEYHIVNRSAPLALDKNRAWQVYFPLDADRMREAAKHLIGKHDFTSFRASECQSKSPVKTLEEITVTETGRHCDTEQREGEAIQNEENWIASSASPPRNDEYGRRFIFRLTAPSFLHHMVRNIVGTLVEVGKGDRAPEDIKTILAAKDRASAGPTAPACGLYFMRVEY